MPPVRPSPSRLPGMPGERSRPACPIQVRHVAGLLLLALLAWLPPAPAYAEKGDREKPINIEADRVQVDDARQESVFTGNVQITQGTLVIRGDRVIVRQDKQGFNYGIAFGSPKAQAYFRQKRDGVDEHVEGWADRLEYDGRKETVQFFTRARLLRGADEVRGDFMIYEMQTEVFRVVGGGKGVATGNNPEGRVRAVIQPKPKEDADKPAPGAAADKPKPPPPAVKIKPSPAIANPRD